MGQGSTARWLSGIGGGAVGVVVPGVVMAVPEPSALLPFVLALGVLWLVRRRA